jgi:hypothetical protein
MISLALDTNLMVFLCLALADKRHIGQHKRISNYTAQDFRSLVGIIGQADELVSTPYSLAEVSNLLNVSLKRKIDLRILNSFAGLIIDTQEVHVNSAYCAHSPEFSVFGLTDVAWLHHLDAETVLVSTDEVLVNYARSMGRSADWFRPSNQ